jgi:hypothetical protein
VTAAFRPATRHTKFGQEAGICQTFEQAELLELEV